jgi:hypothetical protein
MSGLTHQIKASSKLSSLFLSPWSASTIIKMIKPTPRPIQALRQEAPQVRQHLKQPTFTSTMEPIRQDMPATLRKEVR